MKVWQHILLGFFLGILMSGVILLVARSPQGEALELLPAPTDSPFVVYVAGAVLHPGVINLEAQSRIIDAIELAGGFTMNADTAQVNLAARVRDGEKIYIPAIGETINPNEAITISDTNSPDNLIVNINLTSFDELQQLPGIGPVKAQDIIDYREQNGPFKIIEDIMSVPGIGESLFDDIKSFITVE